MAKKDDSSTPEELENEALNEELHEEEEQQPENDLPEEEAAAAQPLEQTYYSRYRFYIVGGIVAVLVIFGAWYYMREQSKAKANEAVEQMTYALRYFQADSLQLALNGDGQYPGFIALADEYGSTETGNLCHYYLGATYIKLEQYQQAADALEKYRKDPSKAFTIASYDMLARCYEELEQYDKAAKTYMAGANVRPNERTSPALMQFAAWAYENAGKPERALEVFKQLREKYPRANESLTAEKEIARLEAMLQ